MPFSFSLSIYSQHIVFNSSPGFFSSHDIFLESFENRRMTSSDCLSSSNRYRPRLSNASRLTLPIPSIHHITDDAKRAVSPSASSVTPTSTSPSMFFTPIGSLQHRFPHPNRFPFARPPTLPLGRRGIEFKPPEQDVLDKNFFRAFNMEQNNETSGKTSETIRTSQGKCRTSERTNEQ